jgi:hypothetical protein
MARNDEQELPSTRSFVKQTRCAINVLCRCVENAKATTMVRQVDGLLVTEREVYK